MPAFKDREELAELLYKPLTLRAHIKGDSVLEQSLEFGGQQMVRWVMDAREKQIQEALIQMGWTPPPSYQQPT